MAAGSPLSWVFELIDRMSKPALAVDDALTRVERSLKRADAATKGLSGGLASAAGSAKSFGGGLSAVALDSFTNLLEKAWTGIKAVGNAFGDTVLKSLAFKESTLASFEAILGSKKAAQDLFHEAARIAKLTPFQTQDVVKNYSQLLGAGFKPHEVGVLNQAIGDVSALQGFDQDVFTGIIRQFSEFRAGIPVQMRHWQSVIMHSAGAGIGLPQIGEQLSNVLGLKGGATAGIDALHAGTVTGEQFMQAFVNAVAQKGKGKVGTILMAQGETLAGLWSNIQSISTDTVFAFADNLKGVNALKAAMHTVIDLFDTATPTGKRFLGVVERITDALLSSIFGPLAKGKEGDFYIQAEMDRFLSWAEGKDWEATFGDIAAGVSKLVTALDLFISIGGAAVTVAETLYAPFSNLSASIARHQKEAYVGRAAAGSTFDEQGRLITGGVARGMALSADQVYRQAIGLADGTRKAFAGKDGIDAHSPSRVFEELGRFSAEGYARGFAGSGDVGATLGQLAASSAEGGGAGRGGTVHIHEGAFPIHVQGGGDAEETARQLRPVLLREIIALFEGLGMEVGMEGAT